MTKKKKKKITKKSKEITPFNKDSKYKLKKLMVSMDEEYITIKLPRLAPRRSTSGKTWILGTTGGFHTTDIRFADGRHLALAINAVMPLTDVEKDKLAVQIKAKTIKNRLKKQLENEAKIKNEGTR